MNKNKRKVIRACEHARGSGVSSYRILTRRSGAAAVAIVLAVMILIGAEVYGGSSLLTQGTSKITAGDSFDFTLNLKSLDTGDSEAEEALSEYVAALSVSPAPAGLTVKESVGSINTVTGEYQVTGSELGGTDVLHFTIETASDLQFETTYKVSVDVTGSVTASDSFSLVVSPKPGQNGGGENGDVPDQDDKKGKDNGQDLPDGDNLPDGSKLPSGKSNGGLKGKMPGSAASGSSSLSSDTSSVTYAGSWDNYLKGLSVSGYEFTREFNKIRDTYFLSIPEDITTLSVSAEPSDSSAAVKITGNTDIPEGRSKIMISVTADDGSVRIYRIYVDRGEEDE